METKKNLNNVQRKILDEVYTQQFDTIAKGMREERERGLAAVQTKVIKNLLKDKEIKKMLDAAATFYALEKKLQSKLDSEGIYVEGRLSGDPYLRFGRRSYGVNEGKSKEVEEYEAETRRIELALADKKKEMRAKIWGASVSYEEADSEIKELLKDI